MHLPQFHLAYITHHTYMLNAGQWLYMRLSEQTVELSIAMENVSDIFEVYSTVEQLATQSHATFVEGLRMGLKHIVHMYMVLTIEWSNTSENTSRGISKSNCNGLHVKKQGI